MARERTRRRSKWLDLILACLEQHGALNAPAIAKKLADSAQKTGGRSISVGTVYHYLSQLKADGKVDHQEEAFVVHRGWRAGQPKAFILVELTIPKVAGISYQTKLVADIRESFERGTHRGLNLISVDDVMGAEFSVIVQVYSDDLHFIGKFVKEHLLTNKMVKSTRTIMVWPSEPATVP